MTTISKWLCILRYYQTKNCRWNSSVWIIECRDCLSFWQLLHNVVTKTSPSAFGTLAPMSHLCNGNLFFLHERPSISPWIKSIYNELDIIIHVIASQLSCHSDIIGNRLWRHQQNENWVSETRGRCVNIAVFIIIYIFVMSCKKLNNVCAIVTNCLCAHSSVILVLISLVASQLGH